jgi:ParB family transcriptional regulator, chromosome partitioning protein
VRQATRRGGLGRGLSALIPGAAEEAGLLEIPVAAIGPNPRQPRTGFADDTLEALARSIQEVGVLQPVIVRRVEEGYALVAGERRLRAAKVAGLATIPAVVRDSDDADSLREALIENLHREDLGPLELAEAFQELLEDLGATQEELAERLSVSRPHVTNTIRLLQLPAEVQGLLAERKITAGHARALLSLPDPEAQVSLAVRAAAEELSVREIEDLVRAYTEPAAKRASPKVAPGTEATFAEAEEILSEQLQTRVRIQMGKRRGKIVVEFGSGEDLDRIISEIVGSGRGFVPE